MILLSGEKGKRYALPNAEVLLHQPLGGYQGQASDIEIHTRKILDMKETLYRMISKSTGQKYEKIVKDSDRDFFMTAEEAKKYGIIDKVI